MTRAEQLMEPRAPRGGVPALLCAALFLVAVPDAALLARQAGSDLPRQAGEARRQGDLLKARRLYEEALRQEPRNGPVALALAETLMDLGESRAAEDLLVQLVSSLPERPEPRRALVLAYLQNGKNADALAEARRALDLDPKNLEGHLCLGSALRALGRPADAIPELEKAAEGSPPDVRALHGLALAYASLDDPRADDAFERVLAAAPGNLEARLDFVKHLWQVRNFDRGNEQMERILRAAATNAMLRVEYGINLIDQGRFQQAARELTRAWNDGERRSEVAFSLGAALGEAGRFEEAVKWLRQAMAIDPNLAPHHSLGRLLLFEQKPEEAAVELERAAALQPDSAGTRLDLGSAYEAAAALDKAEAAYREALKLDPTLPAAHYALGTLLARKGQRAEAAEHLAIYRVAFEKQQEATRRGVARQSELDLGWVELRRGHPARALTQFERYPDDPEALRGAARSLIQLGREAEALRKYERAVALAPEDAGLRYELDRESGRLRKK